MKLRLRSLAPRQTLRIELQDSCTLPQLKQILSQTLPNSPSPASIRISLNRRDDLQSDGEDSLLSLGVAAGDLLYFSIEQSAAGTTSNSQNTLSPINPTPVPVSNMAECSTRSDTLNTLPLAQNSDSVKGKIKVGDTSTEKNIDEMDVDKEYSVNSYTSDAWVKSFSVPGYLRKTLREGLGDDGKPHHKLIITAVDQVMKEMGLLGLYRNPNVRFEQPFGLFRVSLFYTLPGTSCPAYDKSINTVVLKFQTLGKFMNVYGTLKDGSGKTPPYCVKVNVEQLLLNLEVVWENCGQDGKFLDTSPDKEMVKFWRDVKDKLALPLVIDLCEEAGLELPPCFTQLPKDLKLKILELLPGADVAKTSCVNSEMRHLGSSDNLWKLKFAEEFGNEKKKKKKAEESWKKAFAMAWRSKKKICNKTAFRAAPISPWLGPQHMRRHQWPAPNPFMGPRVIGDELDDLFGVVGQLDRQMHRRFAPVYNATRRSGGRVI